MKFLIKLKEWTEPVAINTDAATRRITEHKWKLQKQEWVIAETNKNGAREGKLNNREGTSQLTWQHVE